MISTFNCIYMCIYNISTHVPLYIVLVAVWKKEPNVFIKNMLVYQMVSIKRYEIDL